jgi:hypothetical protein
VRDAMQLTRVRATQLRPHAHAHARTRTRADHASRVAGGAGD